MKREILCVSCTRKAREMFPSDTPYPGEYVKFYVGLSKDQFICDHCAAEIQPGRTCSAFSIWTDSRPYHAWEHDYVTGIDDPAFTYLAAMGQGFTATG